MKSFLEKLAGVAMVSIILLSCAVSLNRVMAYPPAHDNDEFMIWEDFIVSKRNLEYAKIYKEDERGGKYIIHIEPIGRVHYDTIEARDTAWSILLRKLKLRETINPVE